MDLIQFIDEEIERKRLKPEYLSEILISGLENLDKEFDTNYPEIINYRKEYKRWKAYLSQPLDHITEVNRKAAVIIKLVKKSSKRFEKKKYFARDQALLEALVDDLDSKPFDIKAWLKINNENLNTLLIHRQELLLKLDSSITIGNSLINDRFFRFIIQVIIFSIAFLCSYLIGNKIESGLNPLGTFMSQLITALLFYFSIDKLVNSIEDKLEWRRVKFLRNKYIELQEIIIKQTSILTALRENQIR